MPLILPKIIPSLSCVRARSIASRWPPGISASCSLFISRQEHSPTHFLRFFPVVMPVKVVRCFHHQRRLRLTTSGGTFS
ncbi:hypothetical protein GH101_15240 [Escherichia coli]|nr:hypothetical protein [Escherichia coli]EFH8234711.1 hypothetical protein [Escherichia coli]HAH3151357.1 hypothetical protein [Escherichia coli]